MPRQAPLSYRDRSRTAYRRVHGGNGRIEHGVDFARRRGSGMVSRAAPLARQGAGGNICRVAARPSAGSDRASLAETVWKAWTCRALALFGISF